MTTRSPQQTEAQHRPTNSFAMVLHLKSPKSPEHSAVGPWNPRSRAPRTEATGPIESKTPGLPFGLHLVNGLASFRRNQKALQHKYSIQPPPPDADSPERGRLLIQSFRRAKHQVSFEVFATSRATGPFCCGFVVIRTSRVRLQSREGFGSPGNWNQPKPGEIET